MTSIFGAKPAKQVRISVEQQEVVRAPNPAPQPPVSPAAESATRSCSDPAMASQTAARKTGMNHPKGHRVANLENVWAMMDTPGFLRCSDTYTLGDVWSMPRKVEAIVNRGTLLIQMYQIVAGYHIHSRMYTVRIASDDLLRMLYILASYTCEMMGSAIVGYEDWLNSAVVAFVSARGSTGDPSNHAELCKYLLEDKYRNFTPCPQSDNLRLFFRKTSVHSYKSSNKEGRLNNRSVMKCKAQRGNFEYLIEGRLIWFNDRSEDPATAVVPPATQPYYEEETLM